nr:DUF2071 domain-containing protein [Streptomyces carpinensis]
MRVPALAAGWVTQTFVHWPFRSDEVRPLVPDGLILDEYDGAAWVSFTPFVMTDVRPFAVPAVVPGLPAFPETNLRTYVRSRDGRPGIWFLSLEVRCPLMLAARAVGVPYHPGTLTVSRRENQVRYVGSRWGGGPSYEMTVRPGEPISPAERDEWLTSRWRAYTQRLGIIWETPVEHEPWPLRGAVIVDLRETVTAAAGLPRPHAEPLVHFSEGVLRVRFGVSRPVRRAA